ncbi:MAG: LacI family DNA-binding transcriptional regulator [Anaerolineae bacterium]|nr:LacI family DNA-binding transcriptional regulator [Anaerolineae bacterium]
MEDIAKRAGVSRGTVSRVLNNHPAVSDETRAHVQEVIDQLNYRPNFSARQLRTDSSNLVGFITDEVTTTPYAVDMIRGAQEALWSRGKVLLVINAGYGTKLIQSSLEVLLERRVEGVIYMAMYHHVVELPPQVAEVPLVLANCFATDASYPSVVPDEFGGGYAATQALLERGHRRIAFLNAGEQPGIMSSIPAAGGRLAGFKQALQDYGVSMDEDLLLYTDQSPACNYRMTMELMHKASPPSAIFCFNDRVALGCYGALAELRLRVPDDVAVVGFDNFTAIAECMWPQLTTVQLPHYEMGQWAVEYLMTAQKSSLQPIQHKLPCPLVRRQSV